MTAMGIVRIFNMLRPLLSNRAAEFLARFSRIGLASLVFALGACATTTPRDVQVQKLQARSSYEVGMGHFKENQIGLAQAASEEAVRLDPGEPTYLNGLGLIQLQQRRWPEATLMFTQAIKLDPNYGDAYHHLGVALAESGRWTEAVEAYRRAVAIPTYPNRAASYHNLGWTYYNLNREKEAEEALGRALQLDPQMAAGHYTLGLVYERGRRVSEARDAFKRAQTLEPSGPIGRAAEEHLKQLGP